jgi:lysophospholipase L1-like esterase
MASASYTPFAPETFADPPLIPPSPTPTPNLTPEPTPKPVARKYSFVTLGDSLTAWPTSGPWPNRLNAEDANLALVNNAGVPGNTTADMLARLDKDVFAYKPDVLFILGGTNDLGRNVSEATIIANLKTIILAARAKGIRIFLVLVPPDSYTNMAAAIDSLNVAITHLANIYTIVAIDIHTPLSQDNGTFQPRYTSDGLHFTDLGAQTVANAIFSRIHRLGY